MRRKVALTAAAVAMVGTLAVGGTLAWFTDTETATNVVTTGNVDITLNEDGGDDGVATGDGLKYEDVMPGDEFDKKVTIANEGNDAYVRAIIEVTGINMNETEAIEFMKNNVKVSGLIWNYDAEDEVSTAIVEYDDIFSKDAEDWVIFDSIKVPESWDNSYTNKEFSIKVEAEAIQAANIDTAEEAWEETIKDAINPDEVGTIEPTTGADSNTGLGA
mgnify:CR=1 FL=1